MSSLGKFSTLWTCCAGLAGFALAVLLFEPDGGILPARIEAVDPPRLSLPTKPCLLTFAALVGPPVGPTPGPDWLLFTRRVAADTYCAFDWDHDGIRAFRSALSDAGVTVEKVMSGDALSDTHAFYESLDPDARAFMEVVDLAPAFSPSSPNAARYKQVRSAAQSVQGMQEVVTAEVALPRQYEVSPRLPTVTLVTDVGPPVRIGELLEAFGRGIPSLPAFRRQVLRTQLAFFVGAAREFRQELARLVGGSATATGLADATIYYLADPFSVKQMRDSPRSAFYDPRLRSVFVKASDAAQPTITDDFGLVSDSARIPGALLHEVMHYLYYRPAAAGSRFALEGEALSAGEMELRGFIAGQRAPRSKLQLLTELGKGDTPKQQALIHDAVLASPMTDRQCVLLSMVADNPADLRTGSLRRFMSYTSRDWDELPEWDSAFGHALAWSAYESRINGADGSLAALSGVANRLAAGNGVAASDIEQLEREALIIREWIDLRDKELTACRRNQAVRDVTRRLADGRESSQ